jgi:alkaline phosphatase
MAGYPVRGNPILGLVRGFNPETRKIETIMAQDGKPYTTLGYQNGGNARLPDSPALTDNVVQSPDYRQQVAVPLRSETHAGEDVPLYATGPGSHRVRGVMDQNEIHDVMIKAMGISKD